MGKSQADATGKIWGAVGGVGFLVFLSAFFDSGLDWPHVAIMGIIGVAAFLSTGFIWNWGDSRPSFAEDRTDSTEKMKRDRIEAVLRDLSDQELVALKRRLSSGEVDDEVLYDAIIGDDGELVSRK